MNLLDYIAACFVGWLIVATVVVGAFALAAARHRVRALRIEPPYPRNVPVPPSTTPPFTQTVASADWFWDVPSDCLSDDAIHSLCDEIERREFQ